MGGMGGPGGAAALGIPVGPPGSPMPAIQRSNAPVPPPPMVAAAMGDGPNANVKPAAAGAGTPAKKKKVVREKNRFGTVIVKVASLSSNRRAQERQSVFTITPRGGLFHGTQCNPILVQKALQSSDYAMLPPVEISLGDSRAHKVRACVYACTRDNRVMWDAFPGLTAHTHIRRTPSLFPHP